MKRGARTDGVMQRTALQQQQQPKQTQQQQQQRVGVQNMEDSATNGMRAIIPAATLHKVRNDNDSNARGWFLQNALIPNEGDNERWKPIFEKILPQLTKRAYDETVLEKYKGKELRFLLEVARARNIEICFKCVNTTGDCKCPGQRQNGRKRRRQLESELPSEVIPPWRRRKMKAEGRS